MQRSLSNYVIIHIIATSQKSKETKISHNNYQFSIENQPSHRAHVANWVVYDTKIIETIL